MPRLMLSLSTQQNEFLDSRFQEVGIKPGEYLRRLLFEDMERRSVEKRGPGRPRGKDELQKAPEPQEPLVELFEKSFVTWGSPLGPVDWIGAMNDRQKERIDLAIARGEEPVQVAPVYGSPVQNGPGGEYAVYDILTLKYRKLTNVIIRKG